MICLLFFMNWRDVCQFPSVRIDANRQNINIFRGDATVSPHNNNIWDDMPSEPVALFGLSLYISDVILLVD